MAKRTQIGQQIEAIKKCLERKSEDSRALADAINTLSQLQLIEQELHRESPDQDKVSDLLMEIFVW